LSDVDPDKTEFNQEELNGLFRNSRSVTITIRLHEMNSVIGKNLERILGAQGGFK
jgi:hypothetical protein